MISDNLKASVIIPVFNGEKTIRNCLRSLLAHPAADYEVIVVNDGSTDATLAIANEFPCRVISYSRNKGRGYARNRGIEAARAPYVLLTDADCCVEENWVSIAVQALIDLQRMDPRIVGAAGRILPIGGFFNKCDAYSAYGYNQNGWPRYTDNFCTSNLIVERAVILSTGLFNEDLPTFEDLDLGLRIVGKNHRLYYQPRMTVFHNHTRLGLRGFLTHEYQWGRSIGIFFETRYPNYHWTPLSPWMNHTAIYLLSAPFFAFLTTLKIIAVNILFDPTVLLLAPFILLSKILFRVGALECIYQAKSQEGYGTRTQSFID